MGKRGKWFSSIKKALSPDSKRKDQKSNNLEKKSLDEQQQLDANSTSIVRVEVPSPLSQVEEVKLIETMNEENIHAFSLPVATTAEAGPAVDPIQPAMAVVQVAKAHKFAGRSEEVAAIQIQTAFRGYMARRTLQVLRGLVRLKTLMEGPTIKRQAAHTLRCMQTLSRVQSQIHSRRIRMSEENQALQRQVLQKHAKELENLRMKDEWDDSLQSKEQIEANLFNKYEAAMRRERALAYAFSHQQNCKNSSRSGNPMFMTQGNPTWGWSWLERWMAANPWDSRSMTEKELNNDHSSMKSTSRSVGGEISKSYARYQLNSDKLLPRESEKPSQKVTVDSPSTPSKLVTSASARKLKPASLRSSIGGPDEDSKSMVSMQSDKYRRHSIAGSSVRDDESLGSSSTVPSYMVPTESARAKSKLQSSLVAEKNGRPEKERGSLGLPKKRLSYPPSPAKPRRHSGPPKLDSNFGSENTAVVGDGM